MEVSASPILQGYNDYQVRLQVEKEYEQLVKTLLDQHLTITTMESCTGGLIASLITDVSGASEILKGAFVTYSNEAKIIQGVPINVINKYGVYSKETAVAMAHACKNAYHSDIGIGITGSIGRVDPANKDSVKGVIYYAIDTPKGVVTNRDTLPDIDRITGKYMIADSIARDILSSFLYSSLSDW